MTTIAQSWTLVAHEDGSRELWVDSDDSEKYWILDANTRLPVDGDAAAEIIAREWLANVGPWSDEHIAARTANVSLPYHITTCAYCDTQILEPGDVPDGDDDAGWAERAADHAPDCAWLATRAHRLVTR